MNATARRKRHYLQAGLLVWSLLLIWQVLWWTLIEPRRPGHGWPLLALTVTPLLLPLLAIGRPRRALLWLALIALLYFCHGLLETWVPTGPRFAAVVELLLSATLVVLACAAQPKRRRRSRARTQSGMR